MKVIKWIKENWKTVLMMIVLALSLFSRFATKPKLTDNTNLIHQIDSLKNIVAIERKTADSAEKQYLIKVDSLENRNDAVVIRMQHQFEKKVQVIKRLSMEQQISYFKTQVPEDGPYPIAEIKGIDSTVTMTAAQFLETNVMFNELNYLFDLKDTLQLQLDDSYNLLNESKKVLNAKNKQIASMDQLNGSNNILIENLNKSIKEERKAKNWGIVKSSVIGGLIGVGIGIFIMR